MEDETLYVAKRTMLGAMTIWRVLFCWLIIPAIIWIVEAIRISKYTIEFHEDYVIERWGIISRHEKKTAFNKILSVSVDQSVTGRMFNFGTIRVQSVGKWDVNLSGIKNPLQLKEFLEEKLSRKDEISSTVID